VILAAWVGFAGCSAAVRGESPLEATKRAFAAAAAAPPSERPCRDAIGRDPALAVVRYCLWVTSATHPPCNTGNDCGLIVDHIRRMCHAPDARSLPSCGRLPTAEEWQDIGERPAR
jgi:hypothetical protein